MLPIDNFQIADYWNKRYFDKQTNWDTKGITTPLKEYFDQLKNKHLKILIPGAGNAYEAEYLRLNGFQNVYVLDIAAIPLQNFRLRNPDFPAENIFQENFFAHIGSYDLIVEQTFFSSLNPSLRENYFQKMNSLLAENAKLVGLIFDCTFFENAPPYGGSKNEYLPLIEKYFKIHTFETAYNSIKPRKKRELFFILLPK